MSKPKPAAPVKSGSFVAFTNSDNAKEKTYVNPEQVTGIEAGANGTRVFLTGGNAVHVAESPAAVAESLA